MELVNQSLALNYLFPKSDNPFKDSGPVDLEGDWYTDKLHDMVANHPDTIFFYTVESTDVFEPDWDFNTVVISGPNGMIHHTYSPECPKGCNGQSEGCVYQKPETYELLNDGSHEPRKGLVDVPEVAPSEPCYFYWGTHTCDLPGDHVEKGNKIHRCEPSPEPCSEYDEETGRTRYALYCHVLAAEDPWTDWEPADRPGWYLKMDNRDSAQSS